MPTFDRRDFLLSTAGALGLAATAGQARAGGDFLSLEVARWRREWAQGRRRYQDTMAPDAQARGRFERIELAEQVGAGVTGVSIFKQLQRLELEDQVHPEVQLLLDDVLIAIGGSMVASRELLAAYLQLSPDDGDDVELREMMSSMADTAREWPTDESRRQSMAQLMERAAKEPGHGGLRRLARRELRRMDKRLAVAQRLVDDPERLERLRRPGAEEQARVQVGMERWAHLPRPARQVMRTEVLWRILATIGLGLVAYAGAYLMLMGCVLACLGEASGLLLATLGIALIALAVFGIVAVWVSYAINKEERAPAKVGSPATEAEVEAAGAAPASPPPGYVEVVARDGWVEAGVSRTADQALAVEASGVVRCRGMWSASPDGNGTVATSKALLPGAPEGALVGKVGEDVFYLGSEGRVPDGASGPLVLAVNVDEELQSVTKGSFGVLVRKSAVASGQP